LAEKYIDDDPELLLEKCKYLVDPKKKYTKKLIRWWAEDKNTFIKVIAWAYSIFK
jgi:hypothetical protein